MEKALSTALERLLQHLSKLWNESTPEQVSKATVRVSEDLYDECVVRHWKRCQPGGEGLPTMSRIEGVTIIMDANLPAGVFKIHP